MWWMLSSGSFQISSVSLDGRTSYFGAELISVLHGKWGVDPKYLAGWAGECFKYNHQCMGYFGIFPSLVRAPQYFLFGINLQHSTSFYFLLADALFLLFAIRLYSKLCELIRVPNVSQFYFGLVLTLSPLLFLQARGYMYEEAILWGITWVIATFVFLLDYLIKKKQLYAVCALITTNFALNSRIVEGILCMSACGLVFLYSEFFESESLKDHSIISSAKSIRRVSKKFIANMLWLSLTLLSYCYINFLKFGSIFPSLSNSVGLLKNRSRYDFYLACHEINLTRVPGSLANYLFPNFRNWPFGFAYVPNDYHFSLLGRIIFSNSCLEPAEFYSSFTVTYPFTSIVALLGIYFIYKNRKSEWFARSILLICSCAISVFVLSSFIGASERYVSEFFPLFLLLFFFGLVQFRKIESIYLKTLIQATLVLQAFTSYLVVIIFYVYMPDHPMPLNNMPLFDFFTHHLVHYVIPF